LKGKRRSLFVDGFNYLENFASLVLSAGGADSMGEPGFSTVGARDDVGGDDFFIRGPAHVSF
jgi:hypothetical protein